MAGLVRLNPLTKGNFHHLIHEYRVILIMTLRKDVSWGPGPMVRNRELLDLVPEEATARLEPDLHPT